MLVVLFAFYVGFLFGIFIMCLFQSIPDEPMSP
jgi:hypothetical protein